MTAKKTTGNTENGGVQRGSRWRMVAWAIAVFLLLLPLVAMQFTDDVNWSAGDFVFAGVLLFGSLGAYELAVRMTSDWAYRAGAGVALAAALLLVWINGAVGITDSDADLMFFLLVPAIAIIGGLLARFRPHGMARTMFASALAVAVIAGGALIAGIIPAYNSAFEILGLTGFFAVLFVGSALLFQQSAREGNERSAA